MKVICDGYKKCPVELCPHNIPHEENSCDANCVTLCKGYICTTRLLIKKDRRKKLKQINESNL